MSSAVEQIKARLGITEVVQSYIKLEKAGNNFRARCPFHNEKTPSFYVSPERGTYHCFGCNKGGDLISFVEEIEGVDFLGALQLLAEKAGIELKDYDHGQREKNSRQYRLLEEAVKGYEQRLAVSPAAISYLKSRGLSEETIRNWKIGYAPESWSFIYEHLKALGYQDEELNLVGLTIRSTGSAGSRSRGYYDRFRSRIMFPLANQLGRVVGFSGRYFGPSESKEAKYVNTPATTLYDKSTLLYGYDRAKQAIRTQDAAVLVEGQFDLLLSHQVGVTNAVAVSGTALTERHLTIIKRSTDNLIVAFDGDAAGIKAARRALGLALSLGMEVRVAALPPGMDPADVARRDPEEWKKAVAEARPVIDFFLAVVLSRGLEERALGQAVAKEVLPLVKLLQSPIDQAHYLGKISSAINLPEDSVRAELARVNVDEWVTVTSVSKEVKTENHSVDRQLGLASERFLRRLLGLIWWRVDLGHIDQELAGQIPSWAKYKQSFEGERQRLILEAELAYDGMTTLDSEAVELAASLRVELLKEELAVLTNQVRSAELSGNAELLGQVLRRCQEITTLINEIKN